MAFPGAVWTSLHFLRCTREKQREPPLARAEAPQDGAGECKGQTSGGE